MTTTDIEPWPFDAPPGESMPLPPHDLAAEEQLLATLMRHPAAIDSAIDAGWHPDDMFRDVHKVFAWAISHLSDVAVIDMTHDGRQYGQLIDPMALVNHIGPGHPYFTTGVGTALLTKLTTWPAAPPYPQEAARAIHSLAVKRRLAEAGSRIHQYAQARDWDAARAVALAEAELGKVGGGSASVAAELEDPRVLAADTAATDYDWIVPGLLALMDRLILVGWEGHGKAGDMNTPVPTPKGWTTLGELRAGDEVFGPDGRPARVEGTSGPLLGRPCYRIRFSDGAEIIADAEHIWATETALARNNRRGPSLVTTEEIAATLHYREGFQLNHAIQACAPLQYAAQELPVDPYLLGYWLGDGDSGGGQLTVGETDLDHLTSQIGALGERFRVAPASGERDASRVRVYGLTARLRPLGVLGAKHIPDAYLHGSVPQRLALLQGLMDTDGTISWRGGQPGRRHGAAQIELSLCDERLARDAHELLLGLGVKVAWREGPAVLRGRRTGTRYRLSFYTDLPVFRLERKDSRRATLRTRRGTLRYITAVEPVQTRPVCCIKVDRPDGMFVFGRECIPTHNTRLLWQIAMCVASGVNPFRTELRIDPQRVLVIDLEVGRGIRARGFRGLLEHADQAGLDSSLIRVWSRPAGLDLRTPEGQADLSAAVRAHRPRLITGGPMYKMGLAEADGPGDFKAVSDALDRVRERHQCALVLEQHAPMAQAGKPRLLRPMGSVLWTQWPEFGKGLRPVPDQPHTYDLPNFREDRETGRDWPTRLSWRRGYGWPWEASYDNPPPEPMTYRGRTDPAVRADLARQDHQDELAAQRAAHNGG